MHQTSAVDASASVFGSLSISQCETRIGDQILKVKESLLLFVWRVKKKRAYHETQGSSVVNACGTDWVSRNPKQQRIIAVRGG
jgi:hypothetical protein